MNARGWGGGGGGGGGRRLRRTESGLVLNLWLRNGELFLLESW